MKVEKYSNPELRIIHNPFDEKRLLELAQRIYQEIDIKYNWLKEKGYENYLSPKTRNIVFYIKQSKNYYFRFDIDTAALSIHFEYYDLSHKLDFNCDDEYPKVVRLQHEIVITDTEQIEEAEQELITMFKNEVKKLFDIS